MEGNDSELFEVEAIIKHRKRGGKDEYLVKWLGFGDKDNSWEPAENLDACQALIDQFLMEKKSSKRTKRSNISLKSENVITTEPVTPQGPDTRLGDHSTKSEIKGQSDTISKSEKAMNGKDPQASSEKLTHVQLTDERSSRSCLRSCCNILIFAIITCTLVVVILPSLQSYIDYDMNKLPPSLQSSYNITVRYLSEIFNEFTLQVNKFINK